MVASMAVMARETWTDERPDDLVKQVDKGFDEIKLEIRDLRAHTDRGFGEVKGEIRDLRAYTDRGFEGVKGEIKDLRTEVNSRFDSLQRTMVLGLVGMTASIVASVIGGVFAVLMLS